MGAVEYFYSVFVRQSTNRNGSITVQIVAKYHGKFKTLKTLGTSRDAQGVERLLYAAHHEMRLMSKQHTLFVSEEDGKFEGILSSLQNSHVRVVGPELIFGKLYDEIGYGLLKETLLRYLVLARISNPGSKLRTIDYLMRYRGIELSVDTIYRFLDTLTEKLKTKIEDLTFDYTKRVLGGKISIVFYDMTTLHFESSTEDDFRRTGFSKTGKHYEPQIYLGLLVGKRGYPLGFEVFEGNISEGKTIIPVLKQFESRFDIKKPIIVADAGLLSDKNLTALSAGGYPYIIGGRIKNESEKIKNEILSQKIEDGKWRELKKENGVRIILSYSEKRARKDESNRSRGLVNLEKKIKSGKLSKKHINNKGYNKYLKLIGKVTVEIDYEKFKEDKKWDGLKGYMTNTKLKGDLILENYKNLWHIEKAFRISKTDLKIRPIYHRLKERIIAHLCIAIMAYTICKELERRLMKTKTTITMTKAIFLSQTMY